MVQPRRQDLYLLQNEYGLIKIGRSIDIGERMSALRQSERCNIHFVVRFPRFGQHEEAAHVRLQKYRRIGEWFCGSEEARTAIENEFGIAGLAWPVPYQANGAERWISHMREVRAVRSIRNALQREIGILRRANRPHPVHDQSILMVCQWAWTGERDGWARCPECVWHPPHFNRCTVPPYTKAVEAALTIWPASSRPSVWSSTALECCVAGLVALKGSIQAAPRL